MKTKMIVTVCDSEGNPFAKLEADSISFYEEDLILRDSNGIETNRVAISDVEGIEIR